ncbi:MAG: hypothetical protein ACJAT2_001610 [Bacteriovoracaceae bacterium]|jgi:hypothetical protein
MIFKYLAVLAFLSLYTNAFSAEFISAKTSKSFISQLEKITAESPEELIQVDIKGSRNKSVYPAGDLYILLAVGKKDQSMTKTEYQKLWGIMNYLSDAGFRVMMNVKAKVAHLEAAIDSVDTSLIMWSSHGNKHSFYDYNSKPVPYDIFKNAHEGLYQFVLSSCHGRLALDANYSVPKRIKTWAWKGLTNSSEFISFLLSDTWSAKKK